MEMKTRNYIQAYYDYTKNWDLTFYEEFRKLLKIEKPELQSDLEVMIKVEAKLLDYFNAKRVSAAKSKRINNN